MHVSPKHYFKVLLEVTHNKPLFHGYIAPGVQFLTYVIPFQKYNLNHFPGHVMLQCCKCFIKQKACSGTFEELHTSLECQINFWTISLLQRLKQLLHLKNFSLERTYQFSINEKQTENNWTT